MASTEPTQDVTESAPSNKLLDLDSTATHFNKGELSRYSCYRSTMSENSIVWRPKDRFECNWLILFTKELTERFGS